MAPLILPSFATGYHHGACGMLSFPLDKVSQQNRPFLCNHASSAVSSHDTQDHILQQYPPEDRGR